MVKENVALGSGKNEKNNCTLQEIDTKLFSIQCMLEDYRREIEWAIGDRKQEARNGNHPQPNYQRRRRFINKDKLTNLVTNTVTGFDRLNTRTSKYPDGIKNNNWKSE